MSVRERPRRGAAFSRSHAEKDIASPPPSPALRKRHSSAALQDAGAKLPIPLVAASPSDSLRTTPFTTAKSSLRLWGHPPSTLHYQPPRILDSPHAAPILTPNQQQGSHLAERSARATLWLSSADDPLNLIRLVPAKGAKNSQPCRFSEETRDTSARPFISRIRFPAISELRSLTSDL